MQLTLDQIKLPENCCLCYLAALLRKLLESSEVFGVEIDWKIEQKQLTQMKIKDDMQKGLFKMPKMCP